MLAIGEKLGSLGRSPHERKYEEKRDAEEDQGQEGVRIRRMNRGGEEAKAGAEERGRGRDLRRWSRYKQHEEQSSQEDGEHELCDRRAATMSFMTHADRGSRSLDRKKAY
jgi:hypothetical protein